MFAFCIRKRAHIRKNFGVGRRVHVRHDPKKTKTYIFEFPIDGHVNVSAGISFLRTHSALTRMGSKHKIDFLYTVINDDMSEVERDLCAFGPIGGGGCPGGVPTPI